MSFEQSGGAVPFDRAPFDLVELGPVEIEVIAMATPVPSPQLLHALASQVSAGAVRLLDFVIISKSPGGETKFTEVDVTEYSLFHLDMHVPGLTSQENLSRIAAGVPEGRAAAVIALELLWAKSFAEQLAFEGSKIVAAARVPVAMLGTQPNRRTASLREATDSFR